MSKLASRILFTAAAVFLFFFLQHRIPLWSSDEGRYAEIAREMWQSHNFIIPSFNGVAFLEKPVLAPALTSAVFAIFGATDFAARLIPIVSALLGIAALYFFAKRIFDEHTAGFSALLLLTTVGYVLVGRYAVIDMLMTFWMSLALFSLLQGFITKNSRYYLASYVFMGLGFLTKGLIGIVLPFFIFFTFLAWQRSLGEIRRLRLPAGIWIIAVMVLPWFVAAMIKKPDFFQTFIIEHHFQRFATAAYGRKRPFWFFIPILFALGIPWTFFLPAAVAHGLKEPPVERLKVRFLVCWLAGILIFFSIPKSKLPYYILPATMPLVLLIGNFFAKAAASPEPASRRLLAATWKIFPFLAAAIFLGANSYLLFGAWKPEVLQLKNVGHAGSILLTAGLLAAYFIEKKKGLARAVLCLAATVYAALVLTIVGMKIISPVQSSAAEAAVIQENLRPDDTVAIYTSPDHFSDLPFHLRRRVVIAGSNWGTLRPQASRLPQEERERWFWDEGKFIEKFNGRETRIFCLLEEDQFESLKSAGLRDLRLLKRGHGKVLIANF